MKVTLELTREHALIVRDACEMLMRMKLGQAGFPAELMLGEIGPKYDASEFCLRRDIAADILRAFLRATGNGPGTEKDMDEMLAYEVYGAVRYALFMHDNRDYDGWSVAGQPPLNESGLPMPKCEVNDDE